MDSEKYTEAIKYLEEIKDRFGDSTKIINMKISCLMLNKNFEEAYHLALKLYEVFTTKDKVFDRIEFEICVSNLINLSEILQKQDPKLI